MAQKLRGINPITIWDESIKGFRVWDGALASTLVPSVYDYISVTYTSGNPTLVVYKTGGTTGTTVVTLTITYSSNLVETVTRT